ncbi:MAG: hypothetical protein QOJ65_858 [Fimbriimonadaceae bacterium]|jgi:hypothetical protein|nr:hypothetical protein [Fimbriimonadaceae bacterium]
MLLAFIAMAVLAPPSTVREDLGLTLENPMSGASDAMLLQRSDRLDPPKLSPHRFEGKKWEFDWITSGFGLDPETKQMSLRFRVYSQERKPDRDVAMLATMMNLRMWELLNHKYKVDHRPTERNLRSVDEYLCWGGTGGGEQMMAEDLVEGIPRRANVIYIYDMAGFSEPLEMARELAHEYGHAVLPAVGGFKTPEDWGNGYLGERLFLRWLRDAFAAGRIDSGSTMGASLESLDGWVKAKVDPLVQNAALHEPSVKLLGSQGQNAMNAYMGLVLYADSVLPPPVVSRSFRVIGSTSARDYPAALVEAASTASYTVIPPPYFAGKKLWLPLGKSRVQGGTVVARSGAWAQVQPSPGPIVVLAPGA